MSRSRNRNDVKRGRQEQQPKPLLIAKIRRAFGIPVTTVDEAFCLNVLWWWRPLFNALDPDFRRTGRYCVPKERHGFFPAHVFETLQSHHDAGEMHSLLHLWRVTEVGERIAELSGDFLGASWPAYVTPTTYYSSAAELHRATLGPLEINLRESDRAIVARVKQEIQRLREQSALRDDRVRLAGSSNRNRHFNLAAFAIVEVIDRYTLLGEEKECLPWANVRKAIREAYQ